MGAGSGSSAANSFPIWAQIFIKFFVHSKLGTIFGTRVERNLQQQEEENNESQENYYLVNGVHFAPRIKDHVCQWRPNTMECANGYSSTTSLNHQSGFCSGHNRRIWAVIIGKFESNIQFPKNNTKGNFELV
jgi:hypothetical protein